MPESSRENQELQQWLVQEWAGRLAQVVTSMTGTSPEFKYERVPAFSELAGGDHLWWRQSFNLPADAVLWAGGAKRSWEEVGRWVLAAAGIDSASPENAKSTFQELLNQSLTGLAQALSIRLEKDIACGAGEETGPPDNGSPGFSVALVHEDAEATFYLAFAPALLASWLQSPDRPGSAENFEAAAEAPAEGKILDTGPAIAPEAAESHSGTIDRLLDVELPVSISFGRAHLPLKEVVKLTTGSIVELNRTVSEPVEVIVNNCVIARGQVVVIEGNFGIRIDHIISRQERLRTLK